VRPPEADGNNMIESFQLQTGLSDSEVDELAEFLERRALSKGGMEISMLDGYLTSIASAPEVIAPSEWLPDVWSDSADDDDEATFETEAQAERLHLLVFRRLNEIVRNLERDDIQPIFRRYNGADGAHTDVADLWCFGYALGMALRPDTWQPLVSSDDGGLLLPILALASASFEPDPDEHRVFDELVTDRERAELVELIPEAALAVHQYWRERRSGQPITARREQRIGRNEPCPCGSGKKYKKCCGRA
jgi:uncharacterized protein